MRIQRFILATALVVSGALPLQAQQHQHAAAAGQDAGMAAMMCGGGSMGDSMQMHGIPGMHMNNDKPGMDMNMMSMMGPPGPAMILQQKEELRLSGGQISRLKSLQKEAEPECMHHMQAAMAAHKGAAQLLEAATPDFAAFEAKLKEATTHMVEGHVVMAKSAVAARDVLTASQRDALKNQSGMMHNMH